MRIVIDMQGAQSESRFLDIGRYTLSFARAIARNRGNKEIVLALNGLLPESIEPIRAAFDGLLLQENIRVWYAPGPVQADRPGNRTRREAAEVVREAFLASLQPDIIHITSLFEGYVDDAVTSISGLDKHTPVSVTLHDLNPLQNPDHYLKPRPYFSDYYFGKINWLKNATAVLGISDFTTHKVQQHLPVLGERICNISTAIDEHFAPLPLSDAMQDSIRRKFGLTRPFVLYPRGDDEHKNLSRLIEAYATLPSELRRTYQLLFVGNTPTGYADRLKNDTHSAGLGPDELIFTGHVSDKELVQIYNLCRVCVFPSWQEGFALPALEAMACGAPVIGSNSSSLPEVIGLTEALFDPLDTVAMAAKMRQALIDDGFVARLRENSAQQARRFSWDETAKRSISAWERVTRSETPEELRQSDPRPRLAFVSPLPPERTGIADYSAKLLPALGKHYDIDVIVSQDCVDEPWVQAHCSVRDVAWLRSNAANYDRVLYQMGNSPFHQDMLSLIRDIPGTLVMHDFFLSHLLAWSECSRVAVHPWTQALFYSHGYAAVRDRLQDPNAAIFAYPANLQALQLAQGVIVHSEYSVKLAQRWYGQGAEANWVVIPSVRSPATITTKAKARDLLGFTEQDFITSSFGFLGPTKLNHRLLEAWLGSSLASDTACKLLFVGESHGGEYTTELAELIRKSGFGDRIRITGFVTPELYQLYLAAADVAVQLRTQSRGETSAAVLDCMNHALPLIVNANGSMAELDTDAVCMLSNDFENSDLVTLLETLWRDPIMRKALGKQARAIVETRHAPAECARHYAEAIESFNQRAVTSPPALIQALSAQRILPQNDTELRELARTMALTFPLKASARRLLLDITATSRHDLKTGIERVARALCLALLESPPEGFRVEPVYLSDVGGVWHYRHAMQYTLGLLGCHGQSIEDEMVEVDNGDLLFTLDLSGGAIIEASRGGLYQVLRGRGVELHAVVFDLLPISMPEVFPPGGSTAHTEWLKVISAFDGAVCISRSVADEYIDWRSKNIFFNVERRRPYKIDWFHIGADVDNSAPTHGFSADAAQRLGELRARPSFLMVGSIEPRKGYLQVIAAFSNIWDEGADVNLVIVGKEGWKDLPSDKRRDIPETLDRLRNHPALNKRLFWLEGISDEYLGKVYASSSCLIAASYGEGFGLPLIEAAQHKLPIIARDIPVFREVAGKHAYYFADDKSPEVICRAVRQWLALQARSCVPLSTNIPRLTWKESAATLVTRVLGPHDVSSVTE